MHQNDSTPIERSPSKPTREQQKRDRGAQGDTTKHAGGKQHRTEVNVDESAVGKRLGRDVEQDDHSTRHGGEQNRENGELCISLGRGAEI